jgi:hypothetical protein
MDIRFLFINKNELSPSLSNNKGNTLCYVGVMLDVATLEWFKFGRN